MDAEGFRKAAQLAVEDVIAYFDSLPDQRVTPDISPGYLRPLLPAQAPETPETTAEILSDIKTKIIPGLTHWQSPSFMAFFPATTSYPSILGEIFSAALTAPAFNWLCSPACTELETVVLDWMSDVFGLPPTFRSDGPTNGGGVIQGSASEAVVTVMIAARERAVRAVLAAEGLQETEGESEAQERRREDRAAEVRSRLVAVGSEQYHSSGQKAANICGVRYRSVRARKSTRWRMTGANLRQTLLQCKADGLYPFIVCSTLGTTSVCAVDDIQGIGKTKAWWEQHESGAGGVSPGGLWLHLDGAYAGASLICPEFRDLAGVPHYDALDSWNMNMHKWLLVNFDASLLYLRDRVPLTTAMSIQPAYLQNPENIKGLVTDYRDWQIPLGRRFRSLKIWFVLRSYGVENLRNLVRHHIKLAEMFAELCTYPGETCSDDKSYLEVIAGPQLALTVVRCMPAASLVRSTRVVINGHGATDEAAQDQDNNFNPTQLGVQPVSDLAASERRRQNHLQNLMSKTVYERINAAGEFFLTSTVIDLHKRSPETPEEEEGIYAIRVVSANERAEETHVRRVFDLLNSEMAAVTKEWAEQGLPA